MRAPISAELRAASHAVETRHLRHLNALGVQWETIGGLGAHHYGLGVVNASAGEDGLYFPDPDGEPHLLLPVYEDGELLDIVAFQSTVPDKWLLRCGNGWALGVEGGFSRHCWEGSARLAATPLDWLRYGAKGLCVLDWSAPEVSNLADLTAVECSDPALAQLLRKALTKPPRIPAISWGETSLAA